MDIFVSLHCTKKAAVSNNIFAKVNLVLHFFGAQENVLVPYSYMRVVFYGSVFGKKTEFRLHVRELLLFMYLSICDETIWLPVFKTNCDVNLLACRKPRPWNSVNIIQRMLHKVGVGTSFWSKRNTFSVKTSVYCIFYLIWNRPWTHFIVSNRENNTFGRPNFCPSEKKTLPQKQQCQKNLWLSC